ncbi:hypothetical protein EYR36_009095, partial [Pleurotus pulmonarius]
MQTHRILQLLSYLSSITPEEYIFAHQMSETDRAPPKALFINTKPRTSMPKFTFRSQTVWNTTLVMRDGDAAYGLDKLRIIMQKC